MAIPSVGLDGFIIPTHSIFAVWLRYYEIGLFALLHTLYFIGFGFTEKRRQIEISGTFWILVFLLFQQGLLLRYEMAITFEFVFISMTLIFAQFLCPARLRISFRILPFKSFCFWTLLIAYICIFDLVAVVH